MSLKDRYYLVEKFVWVWLPSSVFFCEMHNEEKEVPVLVEIGNLREKSLYFGRGRLEGRSRWSREVECREILRLLL